MEIPGSENPNKEGRSCAFCLVELNSCDVKLCGGCNKRAYCSKNCQVNDWKNPKSKTGQMGQGHKNWCNLGVGEEGIDWIVTPIQGKGLGVVALRDFDDMSRIMVEACQFSPSSHPSTIDLMPTNGSLYEKWALNSVGCGSSDDCPDGVLCLKLARVNHSCDANSSHYYSAGFRVKILTADRKILKGEEICISYSAINGYEEREFSPSFHAALLEKKWGIIRPIDCFCKCEDILKKVKSARSYFLKLGNYRSSCRVAEAINCVKELEEIQKKLGSSWKYRESNYFDGFQLGVAYRKFHSYARKCLENSSKIMSSIDHPNSKRNLELIEWMKCNMSSHPNYCAGDF